MSVPRSAVRAAALAADDPALAALVAEHPVWGPALAYRTPATDAAERTFAAAADEAGRRELGLSASLSFAPSVAWRGVSGAAPSGPAWHGDVVAAVGYRFDAERVARGRLDLHRAAVARTERAHRDLRAALGLHVDLQRAHLALAAAEDAAAARADTLADAEAAALGRDPAAAPSTTLAASQLAFERAMTDVERAARDVAATARAAASAGFDAGVAEAVHRDRWAPLPLEGWRLWLPGATPEATPAVLRAELDAAIAAAALAHIRVGGVLDDLALDVSYVHPEGRFRATLDLDEGRPGAAVDATLRPAARASWSVAVGATVRIDDRTAAALAMARADAETAQAALAAARAAVGFDRERDAFYRAWNAYALAVERYLVVAGSPGGVLAPP